MDPIEFDRRLRDVREANRRALDYCERPTSGPEMLFHFTDCTGLIGIVRDKVLWASLATTTNDRSEGRYGFDRAREFLASGACATAPDFAEAVSDCMNQENLPIDARVEFRTYLVSMCGRVDRSVHWLHYGRSGTGIALGFDRAGFRDAGWNVVPVIYSRNEQNELLERFISSVWEAVLKQLTDLPEEDRAHFLSFSAYITANSISALTAQFKDPAFESEEEWRLVVYEAVGLAINKSIGVEIPTRFRSAPGRVIAYKELHWGNASLRKVVLGASCPMDHDDQALSVLINDAKLAAVPIIERSAVPVR